MRSDQATRSAASRRAYIRPRSSEAERERREQILEEVEEDIYTVTSDPQMDNLREVEEATEEGEVRVVLF